MQDYTLVSNLSLHCRDEKTQRVVGIATGSATRLRFAKDGWETDFVNAPIAAEWPEVTWGKQQGVRDMSSDRDLLLGAGISPIRVWDA